MRSLSNIEEERIHFLGIALTMILAEALENEWRSRHSSQSAATCRHLHKLLRAQGYCKHQQKVVHTIIYTM
jgi:hypothetical protein